MARGYYTSPESKAAPQIMTATLVLNDVTNKSQSNNPPP